MLPLVGVDLTNYAQIIARAQSSRGFFIGDLALVPP
jgi:hypothetical protein